MISNLHTHTTFCDGKNTPEEILLQAMENGFCSIGFSGHGHTPFDLRYCMKNTDGYIREISRLKEKHKNDIEVYLGVEEDAFSPVDRTLFDYIIGSSHYIFVDGKYYPVDSSYDYLKKGLSAFQNDPVKLAHAYYKPFCEYIRTRKPDIVGHFDLITKFDELDHPLFLENKTYLKISEEYIAYAAMSGCLFEVNTGAVCRGLRTTVYPYENLLRILCKNGNGVILSSDSHSADTLTWGFEDIKKYLRDIGFEYTYILHGGQFVRDPL